MILQKGDEFKCPWCDKGEGNPVEDYVVPMRYTKCRDRCGWCDKFFTVREDRDSGHFDVLPA